MEDEDALSTEDLLALRPGIWIVPSQVLAQLVA